MADAGELTVDRELEKGLRCVQQLLVDPRDALAFHGMVRHLTTSIKNAFSSSQAMATGTRDVRSRMQATRQHVQLIVDTLDRADRPLAARAMLSQAFISAARGDKRPGHGASQRTSGRDVYALCERLDYGVLSLQRTRDLYAAGTKPAATGTQKSKAAEEDPGFWRNYTLDVDRTVAGCLDALIGLLTFLLTVRDDDDDDDNHHGRQDPTDLLNLGEDSMPQISSTTAEHNDEIDLAGESLSKHGHILLVELGDDSNLIRATVDGHVARCRILRSLCEGDSRSAGILGIEMAQLRPLFDRTAG